MTFALSETSFSGGPGGESNSVSVVGPAGCSWSAASNAAFVTITSGVSGTGPGTVDFTVAPNLLGHPARQRFSCRTDPHRHAIRCQPGARFSRSTGAT